MTEEPVRAGICEPDDALRGVMERALRQGGLRTTAVATGAEAVARFTATPQDVLVVGVQLPDTDGRDVCRHLRERGMTTPVLFTSKDPGVASRRAALAAGGDDYLVKPFQLAELLIRVGGLIRLQPTARTRLDPGTMSVTAAGGRADLTPTEFRLLACLAARRGELVGRGELAGAGWPSGAAVSDNTLDAYLARIRRKLRAAGAAEEIRTRRGAGYELAFPHPARRAADAGPLTGA